VLSDEAIQPAPVASGDAEFALLWTTEQVPADNIDDVAGNSRGAGLTIKGGSVLRIVDFLPGARSPMHRSHSIDYGLVIQGRVDMQLDGGELKHFGVGDVVVQRGTNHLWINPSATEPARMAFILIEAKPIVIGGRTMDDNLL
jgi:quercetin dioxygenase-like cupin family protein